MNRNLIMDIGMSEGNDTAFYLAKGFDVVGVEADPITYENLTVRFAQQIQDGRLHIIHAAVGAATGAVVEFWRNDTHQGLSSLHKDGQASEGGRQTRYEVLSLAWPELMAIHGVPHYLKVDVEGGEAPFLESVKGGDERPNFISAEAHSFRPVELLRELGYHRFKLVSQTILQKFPVPNPALEGGYVSNPDWTHASGLFGEELPGEWLSFEDLEQVYRAANLLRSHPTAQLTWFDCHAGF